MSDDPQTPYQGDAYSKFERIAEWPMMALSLLFVAAFIVEDVPSVAEPYRNLAGTCSWLIWAAFALEYLAKLVLARFRARFLKTHLLDLVVVAIPALRVLRLARLLRLLRLARAATAVLVVARQVGETRRIGPRAGLVFVLALVVLVLLVGGYLIHCIEAPTNPQFDSYGESVWWALVTATTVGYGDACPATPAGRAVAGFFMVVGICLFGVVSAAAAAYFVGGEQDSRQTELVTYIRDISERLERIEQALASDSESEEQ